MSISKLAVVVFFSYMFLDILSASSQSVQPTTNNKILLNSSSAGSSSKSIVVNTPTPEPVSVLKVPEHSFPKPKLWGYYPNKNYEIWVAKNYKDYIIPENKIVKWFSDNVYFYQQHDLLNPYQLYPRYTSGQTKYTLKPDATFINFTYESDSDDLFREVEQLVDFDSSGKRDFWLNPDYYITNGFRGDCEDYALLWASVFENWGVPYVIVGGYSTGQRDWWIEFIYKNKKYIGQVQMGMFEKGKTPEQFTFMPIQMFTKTMTIQPYNQYWDRI